jgi:hypothetical protein
MPRTARTGRTARTARTARRPRFLNPVELIDFTRFFAGEVTAGRYPYVDFDADTRWHQRIYRDQRLDVWLISWLPSQGTQLHDHGGSAGSFTVVSGVLSEAVYGAGRLHERQRPAGDSVGFGPTYVHDVRNLGDEPAVSVHAYSRPLTSMTYYDVAGGEQGGGELVPLASVATDDPEAPLDIRVAS